MADVKISALPLASTPLAGTEVLPIVQSATTDQVSVANLTAGRAVSAASLTLTTTPLAVGSGGTGLTSLTAGYIPFGAGTSAFGNDSNLFWDNTNKRLGIGTASPATGVDIYGGLFVRSGNSIRYYRSDNASYTELNDQGSSSFVLNNVNGDGFVFKAGSATTHMTLNSAGNLGLGNSSPSTYANGQGTTLVVGSSVNWATIQGRSDGPSGAGNGVSYGGSYSTNPINGARIFVAASGSGGQQGQILFYTKNVDDNVTQPSVRMTLDPSGLLGIEGQTSPRASLSFAATTSGSAGNTGKIRLYDDGASNQYGFGISAGSLDIVSGTTGAINFWTSSGSTRTVTIDSSGNLLVGTTLANGTLNVMSNSSALSATFYGRSSDNQSNIFFYSNNGATQYATLSVAATYANLNVITNSPLTFGTNNTERVRIDSSGNLLVGKTGSGSAATNGGEIGASGYGLFVRASAVPLLVGRNTNDGTLVSFYQDNTEEGNISVSGTTVSYNGGHLSRWSQLLTGERNASILKGTVMSNLDAMCVWEKDGVPEVNEQLNRMKVSDIEGDINVAGVFVNWDNDDNNNPYDMNIAMTGDMIIRIADDVLVQKGDLLMSAGDGTAKPQGDDIVRSKTIAKVTSNHITCTYDDGSYCVPCVLMAC